MYFPKVFWAVAAAVWMLAAPLRGSAAAEDLIVEHSPAAGHYATVQAAINHAASVLANPGNTTSFRIFIKADPVPYSGSFTPISGVPILGESTAGTFITGSGSGTLVNVSNVSSVTIRNLTFRSAGTGIAVSNSSAVQIRNNVFEVGLGGVAVSVVNSPATSIINNTFVKNGTALSTDSNVTVVNDIFYLNTRAISTPLSLTDLSYSFFNGNSANGVTNLGLHSIPNTQVPDQSPLFVDQANRDYHLQAGSPAKGTGSPSYPNSFDAATFDMGAYGGTFADSGVAAVIDVASSVSGDTVTVTWAPSSSSTVTAYRVYYGSSSGIYNGTEAAEGPSPTTVNAPTTTASLSGFPLTPPAAPAAPVINPPMPLNHALGVSWTPVPGATGYRIYYSITDFTSTTLPATYFDVEGGSTSSTVITDLLNGTRYTVAVAALVQRKIFAAVTAVVDAGIASAPGTGNESLYSQETSSPIGPLQVGPASITLRDYPEATAAFPSLGAGVGCFIATAAYGSYLAPQVELLRRFRDRCLLTNAPGRAFVSWYYRNGPAGARFITAHPWLKPPVRLALLPLVALAAFSGCVPQQAQAGLLLLALSLAAAFCLKRRRRLTRTDEVS